MPQLRLALAQVDPVVGDLAGNADLVVSWVRHAAQRGAHVVAFPEMMLTGYPAEDLVLRQSFVEASATLVDTLAARLAAEGLGHLAVIVGYVDRHGLAGSPAIPGARALPTDAAAFLHGGRVVARYAKYHLPNYGVFDEFRYFTQGRQLPVVRHLGVDIVMTVCEDMWQDGGPITAAGLAHAGLVININGSPFECGKSDARLRLAQRRAAECQAVVAYVNMVGGQDELIFDGDSFVVTPTGQPLARAPRFEEGLVVVDLGLPAASDDRVGRVDVGSGFMQVERIDLRTPPVAAYDAQPAGIAADRGLDADIYQALVTATRDYVRKNRFASVVLGLSGGIDSALVATIAVDALGATAVHTVAMPSRWSSDHSMTDAAELARRQGVDHQVIAIDDVVAAFEAQVPLHGLAAENLQARVRGTILMGLSNEHGHLVLTTGNKSELAAGYSTLYGDSAGGFAPIKDIPKSMVWKLARWRNAKAVATGGQPPIPQNSIDKPPSAELRADQLDTDSLPDYAVLDPVLQAYVEHDLGRDAMIAAGHDAAVVDQVIRLVDGAEYKRRQYPPGPKITVRNFGRDRRLPITNQWREPSRG